MSIVSRIGILDILIVAGVGYAGTVLIKNGRLTDWIRNLKLLLKELLNSEYQGEIEGDLEQDFESFSLFDGFEDERFRAMIWEEGYQDSKSADLIDCERGKLASYLQEQSKLSGRSLGLFTYSGTPDLKGFKDVVETLL